jgi:peptidoglycan hydrolase-like protein with peptidoglycan-binding domain
VLVAGLIVITGLAVAAVLVGRDFESPDQLAANAAPPSPSVITSTVKFGPLAATVVLRAEVTEVDPVKVTVPGDLGGSLPVVTSVNAKAGGTVHNGEELLTVAEHPVFVMAGRIPAFREMAPGTSGVDVAQLQAGLAAAGYGTSPDPTGYYGPGTQASVLAFYKSVGVQPALTSPDAEQTLTSLLSASSSADDALAQAQDKFAEDERSGAAKTKLTADSEAVGSAQTKANLARQSLTNAQQTTGAMVPLGEVVFAPQLPERLISLSVAAGATATGTIAEIGSGKVMLSGQTDSSGQSQLHPGMRATATSDVTGVSFGVTVVNVGTTPLSSSESSGAPGYAVTFSPAEPLPTDVVGQNVAVTITTASSGVRVFSVPVAAVSTSASGSTYVTTILGDHERVVMVRLGLSAGGEQAVTPISGGALRPGDQVVIGSVAGTG